MKLTKIPRNIFQTWETKHVSDGFTMLMQTWKYNNLHYAHFLFDGKEREQFIQKHFDDAIYKAYCKIIPGAFKADLWRYCVLFVYGGVYVDIDTICLNNIDTFLDENIEFMTTVDLNNCPYYGKYNLSNGFIASIPGHPILMNCIQRIVYNVENNIVPFSNLDFSGPGVLGKSTNTFMGNNENDPFVGKEGIHCHGTFKLLKFEYDTEYIKDITNHKILFQNKNGNKMISDIYNDEIKNIKYVCWGTCKNPIQQIENVNTNTNATNATIVTMFYKIREKEPNPDGTKFSRSVDKYIELAKQFIMKLNYPLIVFTDDDELIQFIHEERKSYADKTRVINKKFEDTYYYKYVDRLKELQQTFTIRNGNVKQETPMYIILNNNKFDFMEDAIQLNPFNSTHFVWMDFGINHVAKNYDKIHDWIRQVPDNIKQMCINPYVENVVDKEIFQNIYHHVAGGLFSGSKERLLKYCQLFKRKTEQIYAENWYQIDEAVMTMVIRENPELFSLYYGDYQGIIANYLEPLYNIDLIMRGVSKCLDNNNTTFACEILTFCAPYFLKNMHDIHIYAFIRYKIITDYYHNNKCFTPELLTVVHQLKQNNDKELNNIILHNRVNIDYYSNKHELLH
jgi:hypothetical protein